MAKQTSIAFVCLSFILLAFSLFPLLSCDAVRKDSDDRKTYIIYLGSLPQGSSSDSPTSQHLSILQQVIDGIGEKNSLIRSYTKSFNGLAAKLTSDQRDEIAEMEEVVSIFESKTLQTQTTRSWDFMGFVETAIRRNSSAESNVIVGLIDTGIWPESESFSDEGLSNVPKKWRGTCAGGKNFTCNKKIIGARYYPDDVDSARDVVGHGSHTASIAAGNIVHDVSFYGTAKGTARGGVPYARIATYVACDKRGCCEEKDILAAFDDAISDGVDIISVSLGFNKLRDFVDDSVAIGSFHAMEKGILTVQAAGNNGFSSYTTSVAPWILTVAASNTDRRIIDKIVLGNGQTLIGNSINTFHSNGSKIPIARINDDSVIIGPTFCEFDCACHVDQNLVKGKIVLCTELPPETTVKSRGIFGVIRLSSEWYNDSSDVVSLPSLAISGQAYYNIVGSYANFSQDPKAEIKRSEIVRDKNAPSVVKFSSRGPNDLIAEILKPDVSAPGNEILAAYSPVASVSGIYEDKRVVRYSFLSGTSMSCPHISGIAAYLKSLHPDWSPAAIKSSILTTAKPMKKAYSYDAIGEFEFGSGHVNPVQASDPGLVYDISKEEYIEMLCNFGYNASKIKKISGENNTDCPKSSHRDLVKNLNYPLLAVNVTPFLPFKVQFNRMVTNVGFANSTYKASVTPSSEVNITVEPKILSFKSLNEKKSFVVNVIGRGIKNETTAFSSSLVWSDGTHNVRSPIVVMSMTFY